jgi:phosphoribosylformylglycinamidine synthase
MPPHAYWFGEDQSRYILAVADGAALIERARQTRIPARLLGRSARPGGDAGLTLPSGATISIPRLEMAHSRFFPDLMDR